MLIKEVPVVDLETKTALTEDEQREEEQLAFESSLWSSALRTEDPYASIASLGFHFLNSDDDDEHIVDFCSPLSIFFCLTMIAFGAAGSSRNEILKLLPQRVEARDRNENDSSSSSSSSSIEQIGSLSRQILKEYASSGETPTRPVQQIPTFIPQSPFLSVGIAGKSEQPYTFYMANALWVRYSLPVVDSIYETLNAKCGGKVKTFHSPEQINQWVNTETKGRVTSLVATGEVLPVTSTILATNAIYFQGKWQEEFDPISPKAEFTFSNGSVLSVPMMHQKNSFEYCNSPVLGQVVALPYKRGSDQKPMEAVIILPPEGTRPRDLLPTLQASLRSVRNTNMSETRVELFLPRFSVDIKVHVKDILQQRFRVSQVFDLDLADLSNVVDCSTACLTNMVQRVSIQVDEQGTVAAALTYDECMTRSFRMPQYTILRCDRPFLFVLQNPNDGLVSFAGILDDPKHFQ